MTITLNTKNAEEIIFNNKKIIDILPQYKSIFNTWQFTCRIPTLRYIRQNCVVQLIDLLTIEDLASIKTIIENDIYIDKNTKKPIKNLVGLMEDLEFDLPVDFNCIDFTIYRNKNEIGVTLWK